MYTHNSTDVWAFLHGENHLSDSGALYFHAKTLSSALTPTQFAAQTFQLNRAELLGAALGLIRLGLATSYSLSGILRLNWRRLPQLPVSEANNLINNLGVNANQRILLEMLKGNPSKQSGVFLNAIAPAGVTLQEFHLGIFANRYREASYSDSGVELRPERGFWDCTYDGLAIAWSSPLTRQITSLELRSLYEKEVIGSAGYLYFIGRIIGVGAAITATALAQTWGISLIEAAKSALNLKYGLAPDEWNGAYVQWSVPQRLSIEEYNRTRTMYKAHGLFLQQLKLENQGLVSTQQISLDLLIDKYYPLPSINPLYHRRIQRNLLISYLCKLHELGMVQFGFSSFTLSNF